MKFSFQHPVELSRQDQPKTLAKTQEALPPKTVILSELEIQEGWRLERHDGIWLKINRVAYRATNRCNRAKS